MRRFLTGSAIFLLASCAEPRVEVRTIVPEVPAELRAPVVVPARDAQTLTDVALLLTDYDEALDTANGRIAAIDGILTAAEAAAR